MSEYILKTNNLCKNYKKATVLNSVSLSVPTGSIYGLIGENGAGKTTLFRILAGLSYQTAGHFSMFGISSKNEVTKIRRNIGFLIETPAFYPNLSVKENLYVQQLQCFGRKNESDLFHILNLAGLNNQYHKKARSLSLGMKQRLAIAIALVGKPQLLILDEPINALDPMGIADFRQLLLKLNKEENVTILLSSHILSELEHIATHFGFIHNGNLIKETSATEIYNSAENLEQFYAELLRGVQ